MWSPYNRGYTIVCWCKWFLLSSVRKKEKKHVKLINDFNLSNLLTLTIFSIRFIYSHSFSMYTLFVFMGKCPMLGAVRQLYKRASSIVQYKWYWWKDKQRLRFEPVSFRTSQAKKFCYNWQKLSPIMRVTKQTIPLLQLNVNYCNFEILDELV